MDEELNNDCKRENDCSSSMQTSAKVDMSDSQTHGVLSEPRQEENRPDGGGPGYDTNQNECTEQMDVSENVADEFENHAQSSPAIDENKEGMIDDFSCNTETGTNDIEEASIIAQADETQVNKSLTYSVDLENGAASQSEEHENQKCFHTERNAENKVDESIMCQPTLYTNNSLLDQNATDLKCQSTASTSEQVQFNSPKKDQSLLNVDAMATLSVPSRTDDRQEQIFTTIYGQCIGDAVGLLTEFLSKQQAAFYYKDFPAFEYNQKVNDGHRRRWLVGDWTDDSDQMLLILQSLVDRDGEVSQTDFAKRIVQWMHYGFPELGDTGGLGIGHTTFITITDRCFQTDPCKVSERVWEDSNRTLAPNGGVMRTSILGIHDWWDLDQVVNNAKAVCMTTHFDPRCIVSAVCVCVAISLMLQRNPEHFKDGRYDVDKIIEDVWKHAKLHIRETGWEELRSYLQCTDLQQLELDEPNTIGYTYKCLGAGFWALKQDNFREAIEAIARSGGDADTNGAVAGALLACKLMRRDRIPETWLELKHREWLDNKIYEYLQVLNKRRSPSNQDECSTNEIFYSLEGSKDESPDNQETKSKNEQKDSQHDKLADARIRGLHEKSEKAPKPQMKMTDVVPLTSQNDKMENQTPDQREQAEFQPPDNKVETSDGHAPNSQEDTLENQPPNYLEETSEGHKPNNQGEAPAGQPPNNQGELSEGQSSNYGGQECVGQPPSKKEEASEGQPPNNQGKTSEGQMPINQEETFEGQPLNNQGDTSEGQPSNNQGETSEGQLLNNQGETFEDQPLNNQGDTYDGQSPNN